MSAAQSGKAAEKTPAKPCDVEVYEKKIKLLEKQRKDVSLLFLLLIPFVPLREKLVVVFVFFFPSLTCFTVCYRYWR